MITLLIYFVVLVIVFSLAWWVMDQFIANPQVKKMLTVVLVVVAAICVIYLLLGLAHGGAVDLPRLSR